jgi:hypothetical protein
MSMGRIIVYEDMCVRVRTPDSRFHAVSAMANFVKAAHTPKMTTSKNILGLRGFISYIKQQISSVSNSAQKGAPRRILASLCKSRIQKYFSNGVVIRKLTD